MQNLEIPGTNNTPQIILDAVKHKIEFSGESRPDNIKEFFEPVYNWIKSYKKHLFIISTEFKQEIEICVDFKMEYFNSSTVIVFHELLLDLKQMCDIDDDIKFNVNWFYEADDSDMMDAGTEFSDLTKIKINVLPY